MDNIAQKLKLANFESSSFQTPEFKSFAREFKREFKKEMKSIGITDITFSVGHFYISGFFTKYVINPDAVEVKTYYFSISDVRCPQSNMMYRTAKHKKDYTGGANQWLKIESGMASKMLL